MIPSSRKFADYFSKKTGSVRSAVGLGVVLGLLVWSCTSVQRRPQTQGPQPLDRISVMSYNVENLFDTEHDPGKWDFPYLPLEVKKNSAEAQAFCAKESGFRRTECFELDWSESLLTKKIQQVTKSIRQIYGRGPDVLVLAEVENDRVLKRLNEEGFKEDQYPTRVLIEGDDPRGIDVGVLSRFPLAGKAVLHKGSSRGILEVPLLFSNNQVVTVFAVHLPSQASPTPARKAVVEQLSKLLQSKGPEAKWIVGGDWNITAREDQQTGLVSISLAQLGWVSHLVGCGDCRGTHNYKGDWSFLDILLFSKTLGPDAKPLALLPSRIAVANSAEIQISKDAKPRRFEPTTGEGVSDHFPIYGELELRPQ